MTASDLTLLFVTIVLSLGIAFVWLLWELEQGAQRARLAHQRSRVQQRR